jgi:hypothetical protein
MCIDREFAPARSTLKVEHLMTTSIGDAHVNKLRKILAKIADAEATSAVEIGAQVHLLDARDRQRLARAYKFIGSLITRIAERGA